MRYFSRFFLASLVLGFFLAFPCYAQSANPTTDRTQLEAELNNIEAQIKDLEGQLTTTKTQKKELSAKIAILQKEQKAIKQQILSTGAVIDTLEKKIAITETSIQSAVSKINTLRLELRALVSDLNQSRSPVIFTLFEESGFATMFERYQNIERISRSIAVLVENVKGTKKKLDDDQNRYSVEQSDAKNLLSIKTLQQRSLLSKLNEENQLLTQTKSQESDFKTALAASQKRAAEIRNRIYVLFESAKTVTFGQAVDIAQTVEKATGVRAAFLLGILTQESNLGQNVGTCNRATDPPEKSWRVVMKPDRDQEPFKTITSELGLDIDTTPVSCPMKDKNGKQIGWGGAMGPAQFIPSTWMGYRSQVTALTGKSVANPWDIRDAFFAAGIKLRAGGATAGVDGEWRAAMLYFSGSTNPRFRFYGDNVAKLAAKYQLDINDLK